MRNLETRIIGLITISSGGMYIVWLISRFQEGYSILSLLFLAFTVFGLISSLLLVINNWTWRKPKSRSLIGERLPRIAIIIPTWSEPVWMVEKTIVSTLNQNYAEGRMTIILTDDSHNPGMQIMLFTLQNIFPNAELIYNTPKAKGSPLRQGEGKAGNLNSALDLISGRDDIQYIETRDADDLVGDMNFLRESLGQLEHNNKLAYVQTIKRVKSMKGDPFGNQESLFYRSLMLSKNSARTVFPCGSGLVWRKEAILSIGGFPTWNIVEDFQSGIDALRAGWESMFIPIVGAVGQVSPEDIPNVFKQRGVWALDAFRYFFWGKKDGLNLRQRLHFAEPTIFYTTSILFFFQAIFPLITLYYGVYPIAAHPFTYFIYQTPWILSVFLLISSLERDQGLKPKEVIRSFQIAFGIGPVFLKSLFLSLIYGPDKKPKYVVTRKNVKNGIYLFKVLPQITLILLFIFGIGIEVISAESVNEVDFITILWALFYIYAFQRIVRNSWITFKAPVFLYKLLDIPTSNPNPHAIS